jgi:hypothetical protein
MELTHTRTHCWMMTCSAVLTNAESFSFQVILILIFVEGFSLIPLHCLVLTPGVVCHFTIVYLSNFCVAFMLGDSGAKRSTCYSAFAWDGVWA